jgi:hypothetical protein
LHFAFCILHFEFMKVFHCDHCRQLLFFENTQCVNCRRLLAFLPDLMVVGSLDPAAGIGPAPLSGPNEVGRVPRSGPGGETFRSPLLHAANDYRLCRNYRDTQVCNWAIESGDDHACCRSCRLTRVVPDLGVEGHHAAWYRLEVAKRRLVYSLLSLQLPFESLAFEFLADSGAGGGPVLTGHASGVITINVAEADDAERERRRHALGEPYRTLLGHMRHESGHYFWMTLVEPDIDRLARFRGLFGDEREDYGLALQQHYRDGAPRDWQSQFVTAYASAHAWEDWAETWAHYLHMTDTVEIAAACGVSLRPRRADEPALPQVSADLGGRNGSFDMLLASWHPLTYMLNNLNRGLGQNDAYPFVLSQPAIDKLRFVHEVVAAVAR